MYRLPEALLIGGLVFGALACAPVEPTEGETVVDQRSQRLARELLVIDTHIDVPYRLRERMQDVSRRTDGGDFDYPRAREGGLDVAFMSIYVPASHQETGDADAVANELIDLVEGIIAEHPDRFRKVTSVSQARAARSGPQVGFALGIENGAGLGGRLSNVRHFHDRGVRYITLTHSENNDICDSSYADDRTWNGLSDFGREVVAEMNRVGMMIDVSHVCDATFEQVLQLTRAPVIASHSSCRHFTPGWERNMSDDMIRALAAAGGVIQINFGSSFISDRYRLASTAARDRVRAELEHRNVERDSDEGRAYSKQYMTDHPIPYAELSEVVDHIDHVVQLVGIDHVGLGSDFDGVGDSLPNGLKDVSDYPNLIAALLERGYDESEVEQILSGNLLRVWAEVERVAGES